MASMFDQYEQASQRFKSTQAAGLRPEMSTTGFIHMKLEEDAPIFSKHKVNFAPPDAITHLAVCSEYLVLALANNLLLRIDLKQPDKIEEVDLAKYTTNLKLSGLFLDPLGHHILLSLSSRHPDASSELLYLARKNNKIKQTSKCRGHEVTAVGWSYANESESSTGSILLGSSKGLIFETEIGVDGDRIFQTSLEQYWRQVFDIGKGTSTLITGIEYHRVPTTYKYFVLVTTCDRLYQFIGSVGSPDDKPLLQQIFNYYLTVPEGFQEIPSKLKYSKLQFCYQSPRGLPKTFAWLIEQGIFHGQFDVSGTETVLHDSQLLQYVPPPAGAPLAFVVTEFHALMLYPDHIKGVSLLSQELVFEDFYNESFGRLMNITRDPVKGTIWAFTEKSVFRYKVTREERNVWQIYAEKRQFDLAKRYCRDNPAHLDHVLVKQAEMYFEQGKYDLSAVHYAETQSSFEEVALRFLQAWQIEALKTFLQKKLEGFKSGDKTQITMVTVWVVELFMNQLGVLRDEKKEHSSEYATLQRELESFLKLPQVAECVRNNPSTIYELMASHGDKENLIKLTIGNKDYERVIKHHLHMNNYLEALDVLKSQNRKELFYQFAPALMQEVPKQTVAALVAQGRALSPAKLLPALAACPEEHTNEAVKYLEHCVQAQRCTQQAIHNYLLSLYAEKRPDKLINYLALQGDDATTVCYDVHYALRLCRERGLTEACVQLSALLGLWEAAVDLALTVSVDLARQTAALPQNDPDMRKKLWLKIAQHVVKEKDDIKAAMQFLQQCDVVKIEDILPFFSDFVTIDHFKDAICSSLQEYNQHIQDIKEEMEEATKSAEVIRDEIHAFRNRHAFVQARDVCNACDMQLLLRPFYLFPCGHRFHSDCLIAELTPLLSSGRRAKLAESQRQLANLGSRDDTSISSGSLSAREQFKADIDSVVASECLYCGEIMIKAIDKPFIEDEDYERVMKEWQ